jgi:hypothetical protein
MRHVFSMALLALAGVAMPAAAQSVRDDFDRGSGERTIEYTADGSRDSRRPVLTFNAIFSGEDARSGVTLAFVSSVDGTGTAASRFAACHGVEWMVDGRLLPTGRAAHQGSVIDGELIELVTQDVTAEWVSAISVAESVRYRVCRDEYVLTAGDIQAFGMLAAKIRSATRSAYKPNAAAPTTGKVEEVEYQGMKWRPTSKDSLFR